MITQSGIFGIECFLSLFSFDQQESSSSLDETTRFSPEQILSSLSPRWRTVSLLNPNNAAISMMHKKALVALAVAERSSE